MRTKPNQVSAIVNLSILTKYFLLAKENVFETTMTNLVFSGTSFAGWFKAEPKREKFKDKIDLIIGQSFSYVSFFFYWNPETIVSVPMAIFVFHCCLQQFPDNSGFELLAHCHTSNNDTFHLSCSFFTRLCDLDSSAISLASFINSLFPFWFGFDALEN